MASVITSAAPPWIGVLIAARSMCARIAADLPLIPGSSRYRPISVRVCPVSRALAFVASCHSRTSGRSAYHAWSMRCASPIDTPQSFERPCAVLPYAIEKLSVFARRRSAPNVSLSSGAGGGPSAASHSRMHSPLSTARRTCREQYAAPAP